MSKRILILGLDAATLDLIIPWTAQKLLPNFQGLMKDGQWGPLQSTTPPMTPVAWNTFATGRNPAHHGVFDFIVRQNTGYDVMRVLGEHRRCSTFWQILDEQGYRLGLLNLPMTYPPDSLKQGFIISGFDALSDQVNFVHPPSIKAVLKEQGYLFAPTPNNPAETYQSFFESFESQKQTFLYLKDHQAWDVLTMVFMQLDAAQHFYWHEMVTREACYGELILNLYQQVDQLIGILLEHLDQNTTLIVLSDHGAGPIYQTVSLNQWLIGHDYLTLNTDIPVQNIKHNIVRQVFRFFRHRLPTNLKNRIKTVISQDEARSYLLKGQIDWSKTKAFSLGEAGGIFINVQGREAQGIVPRESYIFLRDEIKGQLMTLKDPKNGLPIFQDIMCREKIYQGPYLPEAPDLIPLWQAGYECRSPFEQALSQGEIFEAGQYLPLTGTQRTGGHRPEGVLFMYHQGIEAKRLGGVGLIDIAPTIFSLLGEPIPREMEGINLL